MMTGGGTQQNGAYEPWVKNPNIDYNAPLNPNNNIFSKNTQAHNAFNPDGTVTKEELQRLINNNINARSDYALINGKPFDRNSQAPTQELIARNSMNPIYPNSDVNVSTFPQVDIAARMQENYRQHREHQAAIAAKQRQAESLKQQLAAANANEGENDGNSSGGGGGGGFTYSSDISDTDDMGYGL